MQFYPYFGTPSLFLEYREYGVKITTIYPVYSHIVRSVRVEYSQYIPLPQK